MFLVGLSFDQGRQIGEIKDSVGFSLLSGTDSLSRSKAISFLEPIPIANIMLITLPR